MVKINSDGFAVVTRENLRNIALSLTDMVSELGEVNEDELYEAIEDKLVELLKDPDYANHN